MDTITDAKAAYCGSDRFDRDALDYLSDDVNVPDWMMRGIRSWYATTDRFLTVVADIEAGEVCV